MRFKVSSKDGYTTIVNAETGEPVKNVVAVSFIHDVQNDIPPTLTIRLLDAEVEFEADGEISES